MQNLPSLSRRGFMLALASVSIGSCIPKAMATGKIEMPDGFDSLLQAKGKYFGTAARFDQLEQYPDLRRETLRHCGYITPEIHLKWDALQPTRDAFVFEPVDKLLDFAKANDLKMHGHTLLWEQSVPRWASAELAKKSPSWNIIAEYMDGVLSRYGSEIERWDVVNEPLDTSNRDNLKQNLFYKAFGSSYVARAFEEARSRAPSAKLVINEYSLEYDNEVERDRRSAMLRLIGKFKKSGTPIDGLGIQAHLDLGKGKLKEKIIRPFLQEVADMGLDIYISELDVKERDFRPSKADRDRRVADEVRSYLEIVLSQPAVKGITTWGLSDQYSWLTPDQTDLKPEQISTSASIKNRGLPYDDDMKAKPLFFAMRDTFGAAALG
jgi:endo-1,4-beta-xylanase